MITKPRFTVAAGIVAVLLIVGSFYFIFQVEPERSRVSSDDGVVLVEGLARASLPFTVVNEGLAPEPVLFGSIYRVEPADIVLESPATVTFASTQSTDAGTETIYFFDEPFGMWEEVRSVVFQNESQVSVNVDRLGRFSLGAVRDIDTPNFLSTYDELLSMAPDQAVGFELAVGVRDQGEIYKLSNETRIGGCGGIVERGNREEVSQVERTARIYIDDVETEALLVFQARWFVSDNGGCSQDERLETL